MTVAKVTEITSTSSKSFDDAVKDGIKRANKSLKNVTSAWVADQEVKVKNGKNHRLSRTTESHICFRIIK